MVVMLMVELGETHIASAQYISLKHADKGCSALQSAALYLQKRVDALRTDIDKHSKPKAKKEQAQAPTSKVHSPYFVLFLFAKMTKVLLPGTNSTLPQEKRRADSALALTSSVVLPPFLLSW